MDTTFVAASDEMPPIYKVTLNQPTEIHRLYSDILSGATISEIETRLASYVTSYIEPLDWHGIWRTEFDVPSCEQSFSMTLSTGDLGLPRRSTKMERLIVDFEVDVIDVAHTKLEATVIVRRRLSPPPEDLTSDQLDIINDYLREGAIKTAALKDLYVISQGDTEERFFQTALLIEQVRFFYRNIWRPWDDLSENPSSEIFITERLDVRLGFYFDIRNNLITESMKSQASFLLNMAKDIRRKLDKFLNEAACSDSVDEVQVSEAVAYRVDLENIQRHFELLENPSTRSFALRSKASPYLTAAEDSDLGSCIAPQVHLVISSNDCTLGNISETLNQLSVTLDKDLRLRIQHSLAKTINEARPGDHVVLYPGTYTCDLLPWLEKDLTMVGFTDDPKDVTIQPTDLSGDVFINSQASVSISGVTIKASDNSIDCLITAHSGNLHLTNCVIDAGTTARRTLDALDNSTVRVEKCHFIHPDSDSDGIVCREKASLEIDGVEKHYEAPVSLGGSQPPSQDTNESGSQLSEQSNDNDMDLDSIPNLTPIKEVGKKILNTIYEMRPYAKRNKLNE